MVSILLVTHGNFGKEIICSAELICGHMNHLEAMSLVHGHDSDVFSAEISERIQKIDQGEGVLVLVDLYGGTPSNTIASKLRSDSVECITGLNMPMLIEAVDGRQSKSLRALAESCMQIGIEGVRDLRKVVERLAEKR